MIAACLTAALMLAVLSPGASGGGGGPKLRITTAEKQFNVANGVTTGDFARCPVGYHVTGGGVIPQDGLIAFLGRQSARKYHATISNDTGSELNDLLVQAICVKGANGLTIVDDGSGLPG
jgi:hypothetical protein